MRHVSGRGSRPRLPARVVLRPTLGLALGLPGSALADGRDRQAEGEGPVGRVLPDVKFTTHMGEQVRLALVAERPLVIYTYPGVPDPPGVAAAAAAQHAAFNRRAEDLAAHALRVVGLSSEPHHSQLLRVVSHRIYHELWSDPCLVLAGALGLPSYIHDGVCCYERLILLTRGGSVERVFFPGDSPQRSAAQVVSWLKVAGR